MKSSHKEKLSWAILAFAVIAFFVALSLISSARKDYQAIKGRGFLVSRIRPELAELKCYEASESFLRGLDSEVLLPRLPMALPTAKLVKKNEADSDSGWKIYYHSFDWDSLPPKIALEALAVLRNSNDGWRISEASMKALEDGSGVSLSIILETARFSEPSK